MRLSELAESAGLDIGSGGADPEITGLAFDSSRVGEGYLFLCVPGARHDGHDFAAAAVEAGAVALVAECPTGAGVPELLVDDARAAMAPLASAFHGNPSAQLTVVGVTGTNGKTTTVWLLREVLDAALGSCGLMGTVKRVVGGAEEQVVHTTPEAIDLQADLARMVEAGDRACVMEASSHALEQRRCDAIELDAAVFTNLTQDHLDYHGDMDRYFAAKRRLFELAPGVGVANVDDPRGRELAERFDALTFSAAGAEADFRAESVAFDATGSTFELRLGGRAAGSRGDGAAVRIGLPGPFNVANALAAIAAAWRVGVDALEAVAILEGVERVPGRLEPVEAGQDFAVLVDYAHTPDSLDNVLRAARRITPGRLIAVFGAGGDRDRDKRPMMGRAGAELADLAIITSDNPRSEPPEAILADVASGCSGASSEVELVVDRRAAIATALGRSAPGDTVVIAGKGHETGQELAGGRKVPFDDREVARELLAELREGGSGVGGAGVAG